MIPPESTSCPLPPTSPMMVVPAEFVFPGSGSIAPSDVVEASRKVPALKVAAPLNVFAPERTQVPSPCLANDVTPVGPLSTIDGDQRVGLCIAA